VSDYSNPKTGVAEGMRDLAANLDRIDLDSLLDESADLETIIEFISLTGDLRTLADRLSSLAGSLVERVPAESRWMVDGGEA